MKLKRVLIMAGGTGGHVFPGLALGNYLREREVDVHWLGTGRGLEAKLVPEANFSFHEIMIGGVRGKGIKTLLLAPLQISRAIWQAFRIIKRIKPDVVVGMGGFASGPGGVASWLCGRPLIIHEQNAKAGMTNKLLSKVARFVLQGFPDSFKTGKKVMTIGNPVRNELLQLTPPALRLSDRDKTLRLLIIGGSLGAHFFNQIVPNALKHLNNQKQVVVLHQAGEKHIDNALKAYREAGYTPTLLNPNDPIGNEPIQLTPFIKSMAHAYQWADVILCRAGALTVAELCAVGLGAIFVPYPFAVDDHQTKNASFMVKNQAAICIQQNDLTATALAAILDELANHPEKRLQMAEAAYQARNQDVTDQFYKLLKQAVGE